jgi:Tol biopolymer transport system component
MARILKAIVAAGFLVAIPFCSAAQAGPPGSTVLLTRPAGFGPLTPPSVNDSASSDLSFRPALGTGASAGRRLVGGPSNTTRYVVFVSRSDGLSPDDDDHYENVYVRDLQTDTTTLVSRASNGAPANSDSSAATISADGSTVAFVSTATNLTPSGNPDGSSKVYKRNLVAATTTLVSRANGAGGSIADGPSYEPSISGDGSAVAFSSFGGNLGGGNGSHSQIYVRAGTATTLASVPDLSTTPGNDDSYGPSLSDDGNHVAFTTDATDIGASDANNHSDVFAHTISDGHTYLASVRTIAPNAGQYGDSESSGASISANGDRVAFTSYARNFSLLDADPAFTSDVYVHAFGSNVTFLASQNNGLRGNGVSAEASISADGIKVAFTTDASNLVALDTNSVNDVYVRDTSGSPSTSLASRCQGNALLTFPAAEGAIAPNGNAVSFTTFTPGCTPDQDNDFIQVFLRTQGLSITEPTHWISQPTGTGPFRSGTNSSAMHGFFRSSDTASTLSGDGSVAAFVSEADEVAPDDDNSQPNVFARDASTGTTELISRADGAGGVAANGPSGPNLQGFGGSGGLSLVASSPPAISDDGRYVAFTSSADNLVANDNNGHTDVFVRDRVAQTTTRVSVKSDGTALPQASFDPDLSADGTRVAFTSDARFDPAKDPDNEHDIYVHDMATGATTLVSVNGGGVHANQPSSSPAISGDGNRIGFATDADNLVPAQYDTNTYSDIYVHDLTTHTTRLASAINGSAFAGDGASGAVDLDFTGAHVAFSGSSKNLVGADDGNGTEDVFVREPDSAKTTLVSGISSTQAGNSFSGRPSISGDGTRVAFSTAANDLFLGDTDSVRDVVVRDVTTGTTTLASRADGAGGAPPNDQADNPTISANGHCVAFDSQSDNLVANPPGRDFIHAYLRALDADCGVAPPAPAPGPGQAPGPGPGADTTAPVLSSLKASPATFRIGSKRTAVSAKKLPPKGTKIKFSLSEAASVSLRIERKAKGRKKGKKCLAKRKTGKRCTRYVLKGTLKRAGKAGANSVAFSGRIGSKKLAKGRYRIRATATDAAGNRSAKKSAAFRIV